MGFVRTNEESPIDESGTLWSKGAELVCDETGTIIDGDTFGGDETNGHIYRYRNSGRVKMIGGHVSNYDWGDDGDGFRYDLTQ